MINITLNKIKSFKPCVEGWARVEKAHKHLGRKKAFPLSSVISSNNVVDTLWVMQSVPECAPILSRYAIFCANQVEHISSRYSIECHQISMSSLSPFARATSAYNRAKRAASQAEIRCDKTCAVKPLLSEGLKRMLDNTESM